MHVADVFAGGRGFEAELGGDEGDSVVGADGRVSGLARVAVEAGGQVDSDDQGGGGRVAVGSGRIDGADDLVERGTRLAGRAGAEQGVDDERGGGEDLREPVEIGAGEQ